jgi:hypothetical protein
MDMILLVLYGMDGANREANVKRLEHAGALVVAQVTLSESQMRTAPRGKIPRPHFPPGNFPAGRLHALMGPTGVKWRRLRKTFGGVAKATCRGAASGESDGNLWMV